jgi:AraC-like DNA-binding protein
MLLSVFSEGGGMPPLTSAKLFIAKPMEICNVTKLKHLAQGSRMRHLATVVGHAHRMVRAVAKLREKFDQPLRIERVAKELGMSTSGFHAHFKTITNMSPLQFQKSLRL